MKELREGNKAPFFKLISSSGKEVSLKDLLGKKVVLYFYPKDMTSGCTLEAQDFRDNIKSFKNKKTVVLGVSPDSIKRHCKFVEKEDLNFELLSDEDHTASERYGVWKEKSMYGRKYMGVERSTFIIDEEGKIKKMYRKVSVPDHVKDVLESV